VPASGTLYRFEKSDLWSWQGLLNRLSVYLSFILSLFIVIKFQIIKTDRIAFLNTKFFQTCKNAVFLHKLLEEFKTFLRFQVSVAKHSFHFRSFHSKHTRFRHGDHDGLRRFFLLQFKEIFLLKLN